MYEERNRNTIFLEGEWCCMHSSDQVQPEFNGRDPKNFDLVSRSSTTIICCQEIGWRTQ